MRLLILGHWSHTGFGRVTQELASRFLAAGLDVRVLAVNHRGEPIRGPMAGRVWPTSMMGDPFGGNLSAAALAGQLWTKLDPSDAWKPDAVLVIADVSGLLAHMGRMSTEVLGIWRGLPVLHYCPIEGDNLNPVWRALWSAVSPVAMSRYGAEQMSTLLGRPVPMIYHGVDTDTFRPVSMARPLHTDGRTLGSKDACKAHFGLAGRKVLLRTDRNVIRKFYDRLFTAFALIAAQDDEVDLLLHCEPQDIEGIDLTAEVARLPRELMERVHFTGAHDSFVGLSEEGLVALYNAADVYISTTGGEGFGLTLAESLACEVPVVSTGWAAETEVIGPGGVLVPALEDRYGQPVRFHSKFGMDWAIPDPVGFVQPTLDLLNRPQRRRAMGADGRRHVARTFSWDTAAAEFLDLLQTAEAAAA